MKRFTLLALIVLSFIAASAQSISVKSFKALPTDMTASSIDGKRIDQNGEVAALIKVVTNETGFVFEGGTLGIVDSKQQVSEIWVWVPKGLRKITIKHQRFGQLRNYMFPVEIESERTYEMVLDVTKVETGHDGQLRQQYLAFQITPPNAILEVNDQLWELDDDGNAMQFVEFGTYTYRVRAANYFTEAGKVTVNDPKNTQKVKIDLNPDLVEVTLRVDANAEIWVNDEKKGIRTWTGKLGRGTTYKIECRQDGHESSVVSKKIVSEMKGKPIDLPVPKPAYGSLNVESTPKFCKLYIDGKDMGETPKYIDEILVGRHEVRIVKDGYPDYKETITITKGDRRQMIVDLNRTKEVKPQPVAAQPKIDNEATALYNKGRRNIKTGNIIFVSFVGAGVLSGVVLAIANEDAMGLLIGPLAGIVQGGIVSAPFWITGAVREKKAKKMGYVSLLEYQVPLDDHLALGTSFGMTYSGSMPGLNGQATTGPGVGISLNF